MTGTEPFLSSVRLIGAATTLDAAALEQAVTDTASRIGRVGIDRPRTVVALIGRNSIEWVVAALAIRRAGHVLMPLAATGADQIVDRYDVGIVIHTADGAPGLEVRHRRPNALHPDLAMLLSTSGSTGCPKLVRISADNIAANAAAIGSYLRLTPTDCAITSLPLQYCYGLSVLESHLVAGASVVVTDSSVVDPCFWRLVREHGVTNVAGVPHSFELMERSTEVDLSIPSLRFFTQAGGRMSAERVRRWADLGTTHGWDLFVMYGQTEATSRIAFLPPHLAARHPNAIGGPVPGGELELRPHPATGDEPHTGELVFRGPNVMMGYAERPSDLARGPELLELATGDLARYHEDAGVFEIIGRTTRFVKPFGLRIDLDRLERHLEHRGMPAVCAGDDHHIVVAAPPARADTARDEVVALTGLPPGSVTALAIDDVPVNDRGKTDHAAIMAAGAQTSPGMPVAGAEPTVPSVIGEILGRTAIGPDETFVSLGGDSLSYVEVSLRLEPLIGPLPAEWHLTPIARLEQRRLARPLETRRRRVATVDTTVVLRAVGICTVLATHMRLSRVPGGAHLLLAVAGYNAARFLAPLEPARVRVMAGLRTIGRVAVPTSAWIAVNMAVVGGYSAGALLLTNNYTGSPWRRDGRWNYWYVEVLVQLLVVVTLLLAIPAVRRLERRAPWTAAMAVLLALLVLRFGWVEFGDSYNAFYRTHMVAWFFAIGWVVAASRCAWQRVAVSATVVVVVPGFFDRPQREWYIVAGLLVLIWFRTIALPRRLAPVVGTIASASLVLYLVHYQLWRPLDSVVDRRVAYLATLATGVAIWFTGTRLLRAVRRMTERHTPALPSLVNPLRSPPLRSSPLRSSPL